MTSKLLQARVELDMQGPDNYRTFELVAERSGVKCDARGRKAADDQEWQLDLTVWAPKLTGGKSTTTLFGTLAALRLQLARTLGDFFDRYAGKFQVEIPDWYHVIPELQDQIKEVNEDFPPAD